MDYMIFTVRTDVNTYGCTRGCTDTVRESALKVFSSYLSVHLLHRHTDRQAGWRAESQTDRKTDVQTGNYLL